MLEPVKVGPTVLESPIVVLGHVVGARVGGAGPPVLSEFDCQR